MNRLSNKHRKLRRAFRRSIRMRMARTVFIHDEIIYATPEDARILNKLLFKRLFSATATFDTETADPLAPSIPIAVETGRLRRFAADRRYWDKIR